MQFWILLSALLCPLAPTFAENPNESPAAEIAPTELKAAEELLFKTDYVQKLLATLKKDKVRWFYMHYRDEDKIVFEFREKREDMDNYPFITRLAVNQRTKECFEQRGDYEKIQ